MEYERAKAAAAALIAGRMYTCGEICSKLKMKGCDEDMAQSVVMEFAEAGILNDEEYAKMYIHDGLNVHLKGMFRLKQELIRKGVAKSVIERAAESFEENEQSGLLDYIQMRYPSGCFEDRRSMEKAKAHLIRRGYGIYDINKAFRELDIEIKRSDDD